MIATTRGNTTDLIHRRLLDDLQCGAFRPGDKLSSEGLAKRYQVSRTPVREALIRLERDGFVDTESNTRYEVKTPTLTELCNLYEIREALEGLAAEKLADNGASPELVARLRRCSAARRTATGLDEQEVADKEFHGLICDSCGSEPLRSLVRNYLVLSTVFNASRFILAGRTIPHKRNIGDEHEDIVNAIEAGNGKLARKLLSAHIANARKLMIKFAGKMS